MNLQILNPKVKVADVLEVLYIIEVDLLRICWAYNNTKIGYYYPN